MKKWNTTVLLEQLSSDVRRVLLQAEGLKALPDERLTQTPADGGWSAAQVLAHLNVYCNYYLPAMEKALSTAPPAPAATFTPGWLGAYFANLMKVDETGAVRKKMKAPRGAVPPSTLNAHAVLAEFTGHQHHLLNLLQIAGSVDLNRNRVPVSIARFIRLKLGDTFMFFIGHEVRHAAQWQRAVADSGLS